MNAIQLHYPILIILAPLIAAFILPLLGLWRKNLIYPLATAAVSISFFSSIMILNKVFEDGTIKYFLGGWKPPWGIEYNIDHLSALIAMLVSFIALVVVIYSRKSVEKEIPGKTVHFYCLYLLLVTGLLGIVVTGDMFNLYVFLEIASLSSYALIAIGEDKAALASFRYLIIATIGASFYLLGVGYLYILTGTLNMVDLSVLLPKLFHVKTVLIAFSFFVIGLGIKGALFPLHVWVPDTYTYSPSAASAIFAPLTTKVAIFVLFKIFYNVFGVSFTVNISHANILLSWIAAIAVIAGCIMAIAQSDLKRMLSYIVVAEVGYIMLGVGMANKNGLTGAILHIINDAFMMACLFMIAGVIMYKTGGRNIYQFNNLNKKMPLTMVAFIISAFSMIGIPPLCGFFSKWYLVLGAIDTGNYFFVFVILGIGLVNAILFFRIIEKIYFKELPQEDKTEAKAMEITRDEAPLSMLIPILVMAVGIILLGVYSGKIVNSIIQYAIPVNF